MLNVQLNKAQAFNNYRELTMTRYVKEGMTGFHKSKGKYINPYQPGSNECNNFERGWTQALKRSPSQLLKRYGLFKGINNTIR